MPQAEDTVFRKLFAAHQPGPCPLDVDSLELALFAVGWDALLRDLRIALPPDAFKSAEAVLSAHSLRNAMVCRDNLVHYKKALLGLHQSSQNTSRDLRRLATFYREPPAEYVDRNRRDGGRGLQRPEPYCTLSDALCTTEGVSGGMLDGRLYIKAVCCLTRHPDAPPTAAWQSKEQARPQYGQPLNHVRCAGLLSEALPGALRGWRLLREARHALRHSQVCARLDECMTRAAARLEELGSDEVPSGWPVLLAALQRLNLPAGCFWWVRCVLIARGGAKALAIVARASWLSTVLRTLLEALVECEGMVREAAGEAAGEAAAGAAGTVEGATSEVVDDAAAGASHEASEEASNEAAAKVAVDAPPLPVEAPLEAIAAAVRMGVLGRKHACVLSGLRRSLELVVHWLGIIADGNGEGRILFVGADADDARVGCVHFAPKGFERLGRLLDMPRALTATHSAAMVGQIETGGWPDWIAEEAVKRGAQLCKHCARKHASVWVRDGVCLSCEHRMRNEGRCPFGRNCGEQAWCVHTSRCLLCDRSSCAACRFHQGDGADVAALVSSGGFERLFVDFDRTLCSTRGGSPLHGYHSIDEDLVAVCSQLGEGAAAVVTRNVHVDEIRQFLSAKGLAGVPVHRVPKPRSKAEVVGKAVTEGAGSSKRRVLFVDDTIAEHMDEEMRGLDVVRFLFVR